MSNKMVNILTKVIIIIVIIIGIIFAFIMFSNADRTQSQEEKNKQTIKYLDTKLLSIINNLNNIQLQNYQITLTKVEAKSNKSSDSSKNEQARSKKDTSTESNSSGNKEETEISKMEEETITKNDKEPDWETLEGELEMLYSTWPSIILDLNNTEIDKNDILAFSDTLDEAVINVKNKDKALSAMYIAKLYRYLPIFLEKNSNDDIEKKAEESKSYIINAYAYAETSNFDKMQSEIEKAESILIALVNDAKYINDDRKYNINKAYILIEELKNSLRTKDTDIFYSKYKNALEELNILL